MKYRPVCKALNAAVVLLPASLLNWALTRIWIYDVSSAVTKAALSAMVVNIVGVVALAIAKTALEGQER